MTRILTSLNSLAERIMLPFTIGGLVLGIALSFAGARRPRVLGVGLPSIVVGVRLAWSRSSVT